MPHLDLVQDVAAGADDDDTVHAATLAGEGEAEGVKQRHGEVGVVGQEGGQHPQELVQVVIVADGGHHDPLEEAAHPHQAQLQRQQCCHNDVFSLPTHPHKVKRDRSV